MLEREQALDESEAEAFRGLADMLSNHCGVAERLQALRPSRLTCCG
jgi:hypothetical protein